MFAEVYPLSKLPRRFSYFDYALPEEHALKIGDLVRITLKGRELLGIIRKLKPATEAPSVRQINALVASAYLRKEDIARFEQIASVLHQSVGSVMSSALPEYYETGKPLHITSTKAPRFPAALIPVVTEYLQRIAENESTAIADGSEVAYALTHALRRRAKDQMLILVPRERDARLVSALVNLGDSVAILTGQTKPRERNRICEAWRTGELKTLIGTRQSALLPVTNLEMVVVLESGNDEHLNERRNPRFDAREAVKLLAEQHQTKTVWIDYLPRLEEAVRGLFHTPPKTEAKVVSLQAQEERRPDPLLTESLLLAIKNALQSQKKVLLFLNRKGVAKRLQCGACGLIPTCGTCGHVPTVRTDDLICLQCGTEMWIPQQCPTCGKKKIGLRGVGGAKVEDVLKTLFPNTTITRLEKGAAGNPSAQIILATEFFFSSLAEPFMNRDFGLVADLMTDIGLHANDFRAPENTVRKMQRLLRFADYQGAQLIFQTWLPEVIQGMGDAAAWTTNELVLRKQYQLPPFQTRILLDDTEVEHIDPDALHERSKLIIDGPYGKSNESPS